jgi:hypothetical protein
MVSGFITATKIMVEIPPLVLKKVPIHGPDVK